MSLTQRKSEPPSPANEYWKDVEQGLACPARCSRRRSTRKIVLHYGQVSSIAASWFNVFYFVSIASKILQKYPNREFG